jgi:hypothetical protein
MFYNNEFNVYSGIDSLLPDTVNTFFKLGVTYYFGGTCSDDPSSSGVALMKYYNGVSFPLLTQLEGDTTLTSVNDIHYFENSKLIIGGDFMFSLMGQGYSNNLAIYYPAFDYFYSNFIIHAPVNCLADYGYTYLFGGAFNNPHNYLGKLDMDQLSINEIDEEEKSFKVFPNPFTNSIHFESIPDKTRYSLVNSLGQEVKNGVVVQSQIQGLSELKSGLYYIKLLIDNEIVTQQIVKK